MRAYYRRAGEALSSYMVPHWITILSAVLAPLVAFLGIGVAVFAWRLNRLTFRQKLFEDRFKIYKAVQRYLSDFDKAHGIADSVRWELLDALQRSHFLLPPHVTAYIGEIYERGSSGMETRIAAKEVYGPAGLITPPNEKIQADVRWMGDQLIKLHEMFFPAMNLRSDW
jgi:hypothetical protein